MLDTARKQYSSSPAIAKSQQDTLGLRELFAFLKRSARTVAIGIAVALLAAVMYLLFSNRTYVATAQVMIEPQKSQPLIREDAGIVDLTVNSAQVESQVEFLRSDGILLAVIEKLDLHEDPEFRRPGSVLNPSKIEQMHLALPKFGARLSLRRVGQSHIIHVLFRSEDPEKAAKIANAVADTYVANLLQGKVDAARRGKEWLEERIQDLAAEIHSTTHAVQNFRVGNHTEEKTPLDAELALSKLESASRTYRKIYESVLQKLIETTQTESALSSDAKVIGRASQYLATSYPNPNLVLALSILCGALGGLGVAAVRNAADPTLRSALQLNNLGLRCLGALPLLRRSGRTELDRKVAIGPNYLPSEPLRHIKIQIDLARLSKPIHSIGIVAVQAGAGSTSIARNLGALFAGAGVRTLLVEASLRNTIFSSKEGARGGNKESPRRERSRMGAPRFFPNGGDPATLPTATINACYDDNNVVIPQAIASMLAERRSSFDMMLFDFPALSRSSEVLAFCAHLDAFLLVCERETTPLDLLASAAATLQTAGGELLGVIVNKVRPGFSFEDSRGL